MGDGSHGHVHGAKIFMMGCVVGPFPPESRKITNFECSNLQSVHNHCACAWIWMTYFEVPLTYKMLSLLALKSYTQTMY